MHCAPAGTKLWGMGIEDYGGGQGPQPDVLVVTTNDAPGYRVQEVLGEVFGLTVRSRHLGSQIGAGLKSMVGGELKGLTKTLVQTRNQAMEARKMGIDLTPEERFEVFGDKDPEQYAEEAERRWGGTESYAESQRRAAGYTKDDWKRMQAEVADWSERYSGLMAAGDPPASETAMDMAEEHRRHICGWFYECPYDMHRSLGEMYVSDERFKAFYDSMRPGLAEHLRAAIDANAARHTS